MKLFRKEEGFTLVELMVVVLIIGILVAIAIPVFNAAKANAQRKSCYANQRTIEGAVQSYNASYGVMPGAVVVDAASGLVGTNSYIKAGPFCPMGGNAVTYHLDAAGTVDGDNGAAATWVLSTDHTHY